MKALLEIEPENEKQFLTDLIAGFYVPAADAPFQLQQHFVWTYSSDATGKKQSIYCVVVGRGYDGPSRIPSRIKVKALSTQVLLIRDLLERL